MVSALTDDELIARWVSYDTSGWTIEEHDLRRAAVKRREETALGHYRLATDGKGAPGRVSRLDIHEIYISPQRRPIDEARVSDLMRSIERVELLHLPVVVLRDGVLFDDEEVDGAPVLVAGRHRLEAWRRLGHLRINAVTVTADNIEAELIEISENLHRAELTALQRDEQIARWIELTAAKPEADEVPRQLDAKPKGGRPEGGTRAAARELGLSEADARRATKVASLSDEAKATAREVGLDDNRTALLAAAKEAEPERQVVKIKEWNAARELAAAKAAVAKKQEKAADAVTEEIAIADFYFAWSSIPLHRREGVLAEIGARLVASQGAA
ncbi:hypothetical protein GCM10007301_28180 [Azorhizobium oxalatiphilum]|uniref:ParB-like N-terminal domain-containing protein n=1 Tax=Azorhizobium oxalatiphilum TaxID=980631 RepID=A0A917FCS1_9HYPH|nr:ParB N-terminal domain-containing protein [Azorhizobium oxalatiphilum]GGF66911.1 hypothetical protein GCM10007301_28180 [Azorhizobium oxalatiphilum]